MLVENDAIVLRKPRKKVREGWAEASRQIAGAGDDQLAWPEFANEADKDLKPYTKGRKQDRFLP